MPWKECSPMDEKLKFVARLLDGEPMSTLCEEFNISRKTGYKILRGRICLGNKKINLSTVFSGQKIGIKEVSDKIWLVTFMNYDLGYFDEQTCKLEPLDNPFGPKLLSMSPV